MTVLKDLLNGLALDSLTIADLGRLYRLSCSLWDATAYHGPADVDAATPAEDFAHDLLLTVTNTRDAVYQEMKRRAPMANEAHIWLTVVVGELAAFEPDAKQMADALKRVRAL